MQRILRPHNVIITLTPKIIQQQHITNRRKIHQLISLTPLWPTRQSRSPIIRIHRVKETDVITLYTCCRKTGSDAISS
jgi:hypothetical protein